MYLGKDILAMKENQAHFIARQQKSLENLTETIEEEEVHEPSQHSRCKDAIFIPQLGQTHNTQKQNYALVIKTSISAGIALN